jgi:hypothetical protein
MSSATVLVERNQGFYYRMVPSRYHEEFFLEEHFRRSIGLGFRRSLDFNSNALIEFQRPFKARIGRRKSTRLHVSAGAIDLERSRTT